MQYATQEIANRFTEKFGIPCHLVFSSSGKLMAQIKEGAPYDIFLSADIKYPNELFKTKLTLEPPKIYASGKLVLWTVNENISPSLEILSSETIEHIAIANPKTAPYGIAAYSILEGLEDFSLIEAKLVYGESISQTNQFIQSNAAEIGMTALAVVKSEQLSETGRWQEVPAELYRPIDQAAVIIDNSSTHREQAKQFFQYLFSDEARKVLKDFGYSVSE